MWGSKMISNYAAGAARGVAGALGPGARGLHSGARASGFSAGAAVRGAGQAAAAFGRTGTGAMTYGGAAGGAAWGAVSDDTSVIGGAMMGAGAGFAGGRYGGAARRGFMRGGNPAVRGMPAHPMGARLSRAARAVGGQMKGDALLTSNKAINGFNALKSRSPAMGGLGARMRNM